MRQVFLLCCSVLLAAACAPSSNIESSDQHIVNGERTQNNEPAVVAVLNQLGGLCTGTLIAPRVVLTAKHCVQAAGAAEPYAPNVFIIGVGDTLRRFSQSFRVSKIRTTPGVYTNNVGLGGALVGQDIAVITLSTGASITPIPVYRDNPNTVVGTTLRAVGFGQIPSGQAGIKYRTTSTISQVQGGVIYTPPTICQGDSGGPLFTDANEVVGIASFGSGACGTGINGYNRVDLFLDMIDEAVGDSGACLNNGAEVCDGFDNDCNGEVDETCAAPGAPCTDNSECITLFCAADQSGSKICTSPCDVRRPFIGCPAGQYCSRSGGCDGICVNGEAGAAGEGETCTTDTECASLLCFDPGDGNKRCLDPCEGGRGTCLSGEVCAAVVGGCAGCVAQDLVSGLRGLGEPCTDASQCVDGQCTVEVGQGYCTRSCAGDGDCSGEAFHCRLDTGLCAPGGRGGVGAGCVVNGDCESTLFCATQGDLRWCTQFCDGTCPQGFVCSPAGDQMVCAPEVGVGGSPCATAEDCLSGSCQAVGRNGALTCTRLCGLDSPCDAGFECVRDASRTQAVCVPTYTPPTDIPDDGGCATSSSSRSVPFTFIACVVLGLFTRRRRS